MNHKTIGHAHVGAAITPIRHYENGVFAVIADGNVVCSAATLRELLEKLRRHDIRYKLYKKSS